jgi:hypothetical protein
MPIRRPRIQFLLGVSHGLAALVLILAACSGVTTQGHAALTKSGVPADHYDAAVFFCVVEPSVPACSVPTDDAEIAAVRTRLQHDADVVEMAYVSLAASYRLGQRRLGVYGNLLQLGDLPPYFVVTLVSGAFPDFQDRYDAVPGVAAVTACSQRFTCRVRELRAVGVVH